MKIDLLSYIFYASGMLLYLASASKIQTLKISWKNTGGGELNVTGVQIERSPSNFCERVTPEVFCSDHVEFVWTTGIDDIRGIVLYNYDKTVYMSLESSHYRKLRQDGEITLYCSRQVDEKGNIKYDPNDGDSVSFY